MCPLAQDVRRALRMTVRTAGHNECGQPLNGLQGSRGLPQPQIQPPANSWLPCPLLALGADPLLLGLDQG